MHATVSVPGHFVRRYLAKIAARNGLSQLSQLLLPERVLTSLAPAIRWQRPRLYREFYRSVLFTYSWHCHVNDVAFEASQTGLYDGAAWQVHMWISDALVAEYRLNA